MQILKYVTNSFQYNDLYLSQYGSELCYPDHFHGPTVREDYLIHYVFSGKGTFIVDGKTYHLEQGNGFLICPNVVSYYKADSHDPWHYYWVGFHGLHAELFLRLANLSVSNPIFTYEADHLLIQHFIELISENSTSKAAELKRIGQLYTILSLIVQTNTHTQKKNHHKKTSNQVAYVRKVIDFIEQNYMHKITVSEIADFVGLDRSYLSSIFKKYNHCSIQEYLIQLRINKSCTLLKHSDLSIGNIAKAVGYQDPFLFSRTFKKIKKVAPKEYRYKSLL